MQTRNGSYDHIVETLAAALELRDDETGQHARRVTGFALALTRAIDPELAAEPDLRYGFLLHDIGKIGVPAAILLKRGPLSEREMRILQMHTTLGEHLLAFAPFVSDLAHDVVACHHERWTDPATRGDSPATRSPSLLGSSRSPTRSTRSRTTAPTAERDL